MLLFHCLLIIYRRCFISFPSTNIFCRQLCNFDLKSGKKEGGGGEDFFGSFCKTYSITYRLQVSSTIVIIYLPSRISKIHHHFFTQLALIHPPPRRSNGHWFGLPLYLSACLIVRRSVSKTLTVPVTFDLYNVQCSYVLCHALLEAIIVDLTLTLWPWVTPPGPCCFTHIFLFSLVHVNVSVKIVKISKFVKILSLELHFNAY